MSILKTSGVLESDGVISSGCAVAETEQQRAQRILGYLQQRLAEVPVYERLFIHEAKNSRRESDALYRIKAAGLDRALTTYANNRRALLGISYKIASVPVWLVWIPAFKRRHERLLNEYAQLSKEEPRLARAYQRAQMDLEHDEPTDLFKIRALAETLTSTEALITGEGKVTKRVMNMSPEYVLALSSPIWWEVHGFMSFLEAQAHARDLEEDEE